MNETISKEELFATTYCYFIEALEVLAADADTQCKSMGNYNVAWEIKNDVSRGNSLLDLEGGNLSVGQKQEIGILMAALKDIPDSVLVAAETEAANKAAMNDPCWISIRKKAASLIQALHEATKRNAVLLRKGF